MKVITIGRSNNNDIIINDPKISRHHLQIIKNDDGSFKIVDFGSTNGTYINDIKIKGEVCLDINDKVRIGKIELPWQNYFANIGNKQLVAQKSKKKKILTAILVPASIITIIFFAIIFLEILEEETTTNPIIPTIPVEPDFENDIYEDDFTFSKENIDFNFKLQDDIYKEEIWNDEYWANSDNKHLNQLINACDYKNPIVRNTAVRLAGKQSGNFNIGQICEIFDKCYNSWGYVNDPVGEEYFATASESIENGYNGDCDDFAVLLCSMILSIGGDARINFAYGPEIGHAFTEVNITNFDENEVLSFIQKRYKSSYDVKNIWYRRDAYGQEKWLNLDWQASYPGGKYFNYTNGTAFQIKTKKIFNF